MNRRNIIIISAVAAILLAGGAYWYFSRTPAAPVTGATPVFPGGSGAVFPSGGGAPTQSTQKSPTYVAGSGAPIPRLYELHSLPVAGVGLYETGKSPFLSVSARYIERGLGNIFETPLTTLAEARISNETRPRLSEAFWGNGGKSVVVRFLDSSADGFIKTRILNLSSVAQPAVIGTSTQPTQDVFLKTEELFLPDYIPFVALAGDNTDKLFYLENNGVSAFGSVVNYRNTNLSKVFNSSFTEWLPQFPNQKLITLTTKPSATIPGHLFFVNPTTKNVTKILGNLNGLTTLTNPDGSLVLYSEIQDGLPQLSVYSVAKKEAHLLSVRTLPEKCVWSLKKKTTAYCAVPQDLPQGIYPDQWYQGIVSFSDALWEIDTTTLDSRKIMSPGELGSSEIDMINLSVSSDDGYLVFMNKVSGTPWVYRLAESITAPQTPSPTPSNTILPSSITPGMQKIK